MQLIVRLVLGVWGVGLCVLRVRQCLLVEMAAASLLCVRSAPHTAVCRPESR
jgi:hypothetical protein